MSQRGEPGLRAASPLHSPQIWMAGSRTAMRTMQAWVAAPILRHGPVPRPPQEEGGASAAETTRPAVRHFFRAHPEEPAALRPPPFDRRPHPEEPSAARRLEGSGGGSE